MGIVTLAALYSSNRWMMCKHKAKFGLGSALQVSFQPAGFLLPKSVPLGLRVPDVSDVTVDLGEMCGAPVERVERLGVHVVEVLRIVSLMISWRGIERGLPQQLAFGIEENRPQRRIRSVFDHIAGMNHEIRTGLFQDRV